MSGAVHVQARATARSRPSFTPVRSGALQRCGDADCTCGCRKKHEAAPIEALTLDRSTTRVGHDFSRMRTNASGRPKAQTKRTIGQRGDRWEREADEIADKITSGLSAEDLREPPSSAPRAEVRLQSEEIFELTEEEEERGREKDEEELRLQPDGSAGASPNPTPDLDTRLDALSTGGRRLSSEERSLFEPHLGHDVSSVRIHTDDRADGIARTLHARAFTWNDQIAFRRGEFAPDRPAGRRLLAHELVHVVQQGAAPRSSSPVAPLTRPSVTASRAMLQRTDCNFFVYDSTEPGKLGTVWEVAAALSAAKSAGGYAVGSSETIEYMIRRVLRTFADKGCDCIEEIQFFSHGSSGNGMYISKTGDEITAQDFNIPGVATFGYISSPFEIMADPERYTRWKKWFDALTWRQQLLVELRHRICGRDAEVYYRSCEAFQGKLGQEFAKASARFWRSKVLGHTKVIGITQPGRKVLRPGEEPGWSEEEGVEDTKFKKRATKGETMPK